MMNGAPWPRPARLCPTPPRTRGAARLSRRPDVTLNQLRYFIEAATTSSMTQAAQNLLVAQSAVSSAVQQLER